MKIINFKNTAEAVGFGLTLSLSQSIEVNNKYIYYSRVYDRIIDKAESDDELNLALRIAVKIQFLRECLQADRMHNDARPHQQLEFRTYAKKFLNGELHIQEVRLREAVKGGQ
jgi:hypothetical protein